MRRLSRKKPPVARGCARQVEAVTPSDVSADRNRRTGSAVGLDSHCSPIGITWQSRLRSAVIGAYLLIPQTVRTRDHGAVLGRRHHLSAVGCAETSGRRRLDRRQRSSARLRPARAADPDDSAAALIRGHAHALPDALRRSPQGRDRGAWAYPPSRPPNIAHWSFLAEWQR